MSRSWFFPDDYLAEMEVLVRLRYRMSNKPQPRKVSMGEVLVQAQAVGLWTQGLIERHGGIDQWLKQWQDGPAKGMNIEDPCAKLSLQMAEASETGDLSKLVEFKSADTSEPTPTAGAIPETWGRIQELYNDKKPTSWPPIAKRLKVAQMSTRLAEGIEHAGGIAKFLSLFESALLKVPEFYRTQYVNKGSRKRPATDCLLCLLSSDKNHKELGVAGWRMFEWADLIGADQPTKQTAWRHPAEEFCKWTGTTWTHRGPFFELDELEQQQKKRDLIEAGFAPADS